MDEIDLRPYGWAPGDYVTRCRDCDPGDFCRTSWFSSRMQRRFSAKYSWRCYDCAVIAMKSHQAILDVPLICDMEHLYVG